MATLKLVIFDCDGVMFDSKDANRKYYNLLLEQFGHPLMNEEEEDYVHSHNVFDSVSHIFNRFPKTVEFFVLHRMSCPGCYMAEFDSLETVLNIYNFHPELFLESLEEIIKEGKGI